MSILKQIDRKLLASVIVKLSTDLSGFFGVLPDVTDYLCL